MHVLPRLEARACAKCRSSVLDGELLHRHDAVAAPRQHGPGHDLDAVGRRAQGQRHIAGGLRCPDVEGARAGGQRAAVERNAVHGHPIERWLVTLGVDVLAEYCPGALRQRQRLDRPTLQMLPDQPVGLGR